MKPEQWIRVPATLPDRVGCMRLDSALQVEDAWPYVVALWMWAARRYPNGDLSPVTYSLIARRCDWRGDPNVFVEALIEADVLTAGLHIVDWGSYFTPFRSTRRRHAVLSPRLRFAILKRDGFACAYCGAAPPDVKLHVDHIHPVAAGGLTVAENLITACAPCNMGKAAIPLEEA